MNREHIVEVTQHNGPHRYIHRYRFDDVESALIFEAAAKHAIDVTAKAIVQTPMRCGNCIFWEYVDTKKTVSNPMGFEWGYCHLHISEAVKDEDSLSDLSEYFQKEADEFCSSFRRKDDIIME